MTPSGWGDEAVDKKSAGLPPEWWQIGWVLFLVKDFFFPSRLLK